MGTSNLSAININGMIHVIRVVCILHKTDKFHKPDH